MHSSNNNYNKKLKPLARNLRNVSTKSEVRMWCELLRDKQMLGFSFLRQRAIDRYIADFFCKELKLVIELDGLTHNWEEVIEKDKKKQKTLELLGYTVLRFNDEEVMQRIEMVSAAIQNWITENYPEKIHPPI
jgi:very-short-patch-repair endonuclease